MPASCLFAGMARSYYRVTQMVSYRWLEAG